MSSATGGNKATSQPQRVVGQGVGHGGRPRVRKQYDHEMTDQEKFALQTVQRAQSALKTINDAIKQGKAVRADIIDKCFDLSKAAGQMLFS